MQYPFSSMEKPNGIINNTLRHSGVYPVLIYFSLEQRLFDAEAEAPIFWPPDGKSQLTGKDPDFVRD